MNQYTLYFFDAQHRASDFEDLICASDAEAINAMNDRSHGRPVEVWRGEMRLMSARADSGRRRPTPFRRERSAPLRLLACS